MRRSGISSGFSLKKSALALILIGLSVVTMTVALSRQSAQTEAGLEAGKRDASRIAAGAVQLQSIHYQRCGHSVTRTVDIQPEWAGLSPDELTEKLDMGWHVTEFAPDRITMSKNLMLFCPQHYVLMPDDSGVVSLWTNRYGEGMEKLRETEIRLTDLPETQREVVRVGVAFDSEASANEYLISQTAGR
ncbi:hypothetical protein AGMMS49992_16110 [Clostridia bacterium]|nr:hypothetical protein AGMMS49992_16110 [Clostridia bacterium]